MSDVAPMNDIKALTEKELALLVDRFYAKVRADDMLGPVFNPAVSDWPEHLEKLTHFWSSIMLTSGKYHGNPMAAHYKHLSEITPEMFTRWLALWGETTEEVVPHAAAALQDRAARIAESLKLALFFRLPPAQRPKTAA
jgi:hemoglobin